MYILTEAKNMTMHMCSEQPMNVVECDAIRSHTLKLCFESSLPMSVRSSHKMDSAVAGKVVCVWPSRCTRMVGSVLISK